MQIKEMMKAVVKSGTGKKANFKAPYVGGKSGTSNDYHDMWFVGLTDAYTMGVWVGKDTPSSVEYLHDASPQLSIWKTRCRQLTKDNGGIRFETSSASGPRAFV